MVSVIPAKRPQGARAGNHGWARHQAAQWARIALAHARLSGVTAGWARSVRNAPEPIQGQATASPPAERRGMTELCRGAAMRAEIQAVAGEVRQAFALLRRPLCSRVRHPAPRSTYRD